MSRYTVITHSEELCHHGILGMKWGVRRYQNKDGSLTDAGKQHYGYSKKELKRKIKDTTKAYRKSQGNIIQRYNARGMTGDNYRKVYKNMENSINNDAQLQSLDRQIARTERTADMVRNFGTALNGGVSTGYNYWDYKLTDLNTQFNSRRQSIIKSYTKKYQEAILKDIGYEDMELGMQMLKEYRIGTGRRSKRSDFVGKDTVTYTHRR